jgi:SPP1 gp7 family putative phage head morphogenesis protein
VYTKARYKEIEKKLREIAKKLKEQVGSSIDLDAIIETELKKQKNLLDAVKGDIVTVDGGKINFIYPALEQIKTSALFKPVVQGMTYQSYLDGIEAGLYNTWDSAIRTGYLTGQTTQQIVSKVLGSVSPKTRLTNSSLMHSLRNSIYGNTRTVLQSFASETRNRVFEGNEKYFGDGTKNGYKYIWVSVLDSRTCIVCGELDGKLFKSLKDAPSIPVHRGCRCILVPYFNIEGETRASRDGYVDSKVTFEEWLEGQDEKTQLEVLGRTRYEMFRNGTRMNQFVDNGEVLTLKELTGKSA